MNIGKMTSKMIFSMERKSGFWISVFGYRAIVMYKKHIVGSYE